MPVYLLWFIVRFFQHMQEFGLFLLIRLRLNERPQRTVVTRSNQISDDAMRTCALSSSFSTDQCETNKQTSSRLRSCKFSFEHILPNHCLLDPMVHDCATRNLSSSSAGVGAKCDTASSSGVTHGTATGPFLRKITHPMKQECGQLQKCVRDQQMSFVWKANLVSHRFQSQVVCECDFLTKSHLGFLASRWEKLLA